MKNYNKPNLKKLCEIFLNANNPAMVMAAKYIITMGTHKLGEVMKNQEAYSFHEHGFTANEFKKVANDICQWNPLYRQFNPMDKTSHEKLMVFLIMDSHYDYLRVSNSYNQKDKTAPTHWRPIEEIKLLSEFGVNSMDDFMDFMDYVEEEYPTGLETISYNNI